MNEKLLAPPKISVRKFAVINGSMAGVSVLILAALSSSGIRTGAELARGSVGIVVLHALAIVAYSRCVRLAVTMRPDRMPLLHSGIFLIFVTAFMGSIGALFYGSVVRGVREQSGMIAMMAGLMLVQCGWARRVGEARHCPQCEYEFGHTDENDAPIRCPECGTGWLGRLKKGRRVRSVKLMVFGVVFAISMMILCNPIFYFAWLSPRLATPVLFAGLYASPGSGYEAWPQLTTRPLEPKWTAVMARQVLAVRQRNEWNDGGASEWFEAMMKSNQLPADLADRYYRESFVAELHAPPTAKPGESVTVSLRVSHAVSGFRDQLGVMFAGYAVGDSEPRIARQYRTLWKYELSPDVLASVRDVLPTALLVPDVPEFQVRAVFWVVYQPSFMEALGWQSDGTPTNPQGSLWFERRELVKTIRVVR